MTHAAESLHWYTRDGETAYTVKSLKGTDRPTNLKDARKLGLVPSVTSIIRQAAAPGLERWKQNQVLLSALTLPRLQDEPEAAYLQRIFADSQEQAKKAAERGSAIHAAIQGHYEGEVPAVEHWPHVQGVKNSLGAWLSEDGRSPIWKPETSFAHELGFGGKVDLMWVRGAVVDFKTKEFSREEAQSLKTWDEHHYQLAAYRVGLGMPEARCAIVYVSVTEPGVAHLIEIPQEELQRGWACFKALLAFWQAKSKYNSSFERLAA